MVFLASKLNNHFEDATSPVCCFLDNQDQQHFLDALVNTALAGEAVYMMPGAQSLQSNFTRVAQREVWPA